MRRSLADRLVVAVSSLLAGVGVERRGRLIRDVDLNNRGPIRSWEEAKSTCQSRRTSRGRLEPIFHADSYGYRPGRSTHDALAVTRRRCWQQDWVLDLDIQSFLEPSSHCLSAVEGGVEQGAFGLWGQYSQAFAASVADVEGL
jgi:hypothetical protein